MNKIFVEFGDKYSPALNFKEQIHFKCEKETNLEIPKTKIYILKYNSLHHITYFIIRKYFTGCNLLLIDNHLDLSEYTNKFITCGNWFTCLLKDESITSVFYLDLKQSISVNERAKLKEYNFIVIDSINEVPKKFTIRRNP